MFLSLFIAQLAKAGDYDVDPSCLVSFNVVDKLVLIPPWTEDNQSCLMLEQERERIFTETLLPLLSDPTVEGLYVTSATLLDQADKLLAELQVELEAKGDQYDKDKAYKDYAGSWNKYVVISALWTCSGGAVPGCIASVLATAWATNAYFRAETSVEKLTLEIERLRAQVLAQKGAISEAETRLPVGLKSALADFHSLCSSVKQHCLAQ